MEELTPEEQALCVACWDKQLYEICLKIKDLPDDFKVMFELKNPENKGFAVYIMTVGDTKKFAKKIEKKAE